MKRLRRLSPVVVAPLVVTFMAVVPLGIPVVLMVRAQRRWRLKRVAAEFQCTSCGNVVGKPGLDLADKAWREHLGALHGNELTARLRHVRWVHAICPTCEAAFAYVPSERTFVAAETVAAAHEKPPTESAGGDQSRV
ncbi:MAG: hypothetical protein GC159_09670 [Phycisphaera sp.]|nr:hypothetical protein [Phycisphaera sp.]